MTSVFTTPETTQFSATDVHTMEQPLPPVVTRTEVPARVQASYTTRFVGAALEANRFSLMVNTDDFM